MIKYKKKRVKEQGYNIKKKIWRRSDSEILNHALYLLFLHVGSQEMRVSKPAPRKSMIIDI
jgi:hypothetical protein